ncbi:MAG: glycoside hydrolase family 28 protein [Lachnospiraceae bacterium]|nr:glycoside hydrolase family 28 protein [Lachnospiraceae bacterium]
MDFTIRAVTARSVTIELENQTCYEPDTETDLLVDGECVLKNVQNVVSLCGLEPNREYRLSTVSGTEESRPLTFCTREESVLLDVRDFGAKGDGLHADTAALQAAIMACPAAGTVYLPRGIYFSGPIFLKSHMNLWIDKDAVLLGDPDRNHYPVLPGMIRGTEESQCDSLMWNIQENSTRPLARNRTSAEAAWQGGEKERDEYFFGSLEGNPLDCFASLISGIGVEDIRIFGGGVIDGNAAAGDWWEDPFVKRTAWRPRTIYLCRCQNICIQDITVQNSPCWTVHPCYSDHLMFLNLKIKNPPDSPNTDGLNPDSCSDVQILGTEISVGDDCIAIKSGKYYMALYHYKPSRDIVVRNCLLKRGHGSVTIGSEGACGVSNVRVSRCIFEGTDRGLRIKTRRGRGERSVTEDIVFQHIRMTNVRIPFAFNMFYFCDPDGHSEYCQKKAALPVDAMTPRIDVIRAEDIRITGADICLLAAYGLPEQKIGGIFLSDITASFLKKTADPPEVPLCMDDLPAMSGRGIFARNVEKLCLRNVTISGSSDRKPDLKGITETEFRDVIWK